MARMLSVDADSLKKPSASGGKGGGDHTNRGEGGVGVAAKEEAREEGAWQRQGYTMDRSGWRLLMLGMFFLFYLALGATVFSAIEGPLEREAIDKLLQQKADILQKNPCLKEVDLDEFMASIVEANNRGVSVFKSGISVPSWSFGQSFFFSSTVVTTIGYGHQSPLSAEGKLFCMVYALFGIPLTLLFLSALVERLMLPVQASQEWLHTKLSHVYQPFYIQIGHFLGLFLFVLVILFLVPAAIFGSLETSWNYLDSLYYCFISLTTVGLGDFIPGDTPGQQWRPLYKACTTFYLLLGVSGMMLLLTVFSSIPRFDFKCLFSPEGDCCAAMRNGANMGPGGGGGSLVESGSIRSNMSAASGAGGAAGTSGSGLGAGRNKPDPERIRLAPSGPRYTQQVDDDNQRRHVVRARSRPSEDTPSPVEDTPTNQKHPIPGPSGRRNY